VPYAVRHPGIHVKDLARRCGVTERELLEDLDFLLGVGSPPFAPDDFLDLYVEGDRVHVALHQSFSRPPRFTESEAAALAAAASALGGEGRERAVKALRDSVPRDRRASFDELSGRIYAGAPPTRDSVLGRLQRAIAERRAVRLDYHSASSGTEGERLVHPFTLAQRLGHWYLYGHDAARDRPLAFRLDRIRECTVTEQRFEPPTEAELTRARLFSEATGEPIRVRLDALAAAWALARPGGLEVQKRTDDGGAVVAVKGVSEAWATRFALSFGGGAEVVGPAAARRHFAEAVRRTLARYA
jgi:proteasome accessory factor C